MQAELNVVWNKLLPAIKDGELPPNLEAQQQLTKKVTELKATR
jgi:hypothetical protein